MAANHSLVKKKKNYEKLFFIQETKLNICKIFVMNATYE